MADTTLNNGQFWLPSEFLTDDRLMDKENFNKHGLDSDPVSNFCFPSEFPYEFGSSSVLTSPVESVTESESEEDDFLTGLTRRLARSSLKEAHKIPHAPQNLEKKWVLSGSPQSTLSALGSPNGPSQVPSPRTAQFGGIDEAWDLITAAAGQVARLKMYGDGPPRSFIPVHPSPPAKALNNGVVYANPNQCLSHPLSQPNHFRQVRHGEFLQVQQQHRHNQPQRNSVCGGVRGGFVGGSDGGVKRGCGGTGVFLPRRYGNNPTEYRKKPGCSTPLLSARVVPPHAHPGCNGSFIPDYDALVAQRNALLMQRRRSIRPEGAMVTREIRLPQEWTY